MPRLIALVLLLAFAATPLSSQPLPPTTPPSAVGPSSFADLADRLLPAVVNISSTAKVDVGSDQMQELFPELPEFPEGSPFGDFFKDFMERHKGQGGGTAPKNRKVTSMGSGFIVDPKGYIVTNNHVVAGAEEVKVILQDNTNLVAKVIGKDKKTDLALLKVESPKPLPSVSWGDSDKMRVGDWIVAIGNPFGLGGTVTAGIISARARDINSGPYDDYLQTDASINRGNSGGPMFNLSGEVIGVNTAIFSPTGGSIGIGFAIPSSLVKGVIDQLKDRGFTRRGWIGVKIQSVTDEIAQSLNLPAAKGALVSSIDKDGPAKNSGLKSGDVITKFDGKEVNEMRRLPRIVAETAINKDVELEVWRDGKAIKLKTKIGELPDKDDEEDMIASSDETAKEGSPVADSVSVDDLGITIAPLNDTTRKRFNIDKAVRGVLIIDAKPESPVLETGIDAGDVIVEVNQNQVNRPADVANAAKSAKANKKPLLLLIEREGDQRFVAVPLK